LKEWNSSDIWEQHHQVKIAFIAELRADRSQGNACYHSVRIFCVPIC